MDFGGSIRAPGAQMVLLSPPFARSFFSDRFPSKQRFCTVLCSFSHYSTQIPPGEQPFFPPKTAAFPLFRQQRTLSDKFWQALFPIFVSF
jgi:hypothetical protein